jgi:hypothetical protein
MPSDPIFDEDMIRSLLSMPCDIEHTDTIQAGAVQTMIDLYDRKVTREEFCASLAPCLALYGQAAKLWLLHNIQDVFLAEQLTIQKFTDADKSMTEVLRKQCNTVIEIVKRMQDCPTSRDKVH